MKNTFNNIEKMKKRFIHRSLKEKITPSNKFLPYSVTFSAILSPNNLISLVTPVNVRQKIQK